MSSVHLFFINDEPDWEELCAKAFTRALELERGHETEYLNADGERVRWRMMSIETLDIIRVESLELSKPNQTGI